MEPTSTEDEAPKVCVNIPVHHTERRTRPANDSKGSQCMKVLIVFREDDTDNLFVPVLCEAIRRHGIDAHCSLHDFWKEDGAYDIIHFQWPEEVVGWNCTDESVIARLQQRIRHFKAGGSKFVYTRHNTCPHYNANPVIRQAYELIESCSDVVVHMGQYSKKEFEKKYPGSRNIVIPHHIYENTYNEHISREEARRRLKLPADRVVITAFGKFRNREEARMVLNAFSALRNKKKFLLAPRMFPFSKHPGQRNLLKRFLSLAGYYLVPALLRLKHIRAGANGELIANEDLPYYIAASDIIFVQRKQILNSGNIPLAFLFRKVVIGPDSGNVGELLRETGNPVFAPDDNYSIVHALQQAERLVEQNKGEENYRYARQHMNLDVVANAYIGAYGK